jgi:integrase
VTSWRPSPAGNRPSTSVQPQGFDVVRGVKAKDAKTREFSAAGPGVQRISGPNGTRYRIRFATAAGRKSLTTSSLDEALRIRNAVLVELAAGNMAAAGGITIRAYSQEILDRREANGYRNGRTDRGRIKKYVLRTHYADWPLRAFSRKHAVRWVRWLGTHPIKRQTRIHCVNMMRVIFGEALNDGLVDENPLVGVRVQGADPRTESTWTVLSLPEQLRLVSGIDTPEKWIVAVAETSGLRQGELWGLELSDVHLDADVPYITVRYGAPGRKPTKSGSIRDVPLIGIGLEGMREWMAIRDQWCHRPRLTELVFPLQKGSARDRKAPRNFRRWLSDAGIHRRVRWHDLRHTAASSLISGDWGRAWSLEEVREMLGHADIRTTQRYAHFARKALFRAAEETNAIHT